MTTRSMRRALLGSAPVLLLLSAALALWAWHLAGRSPQSTAVVLASVASVVFGVAGVLCGALGLRQGPARGTDPDTGTPAVVVHGPVSSGNHVPVVGAGPGWLWALAGVVLLAALASVASLVVALRGGAAPDVVRVGAYTVTLRGSAVGGDPFELQGELRVRPGTDGRPYEWCLQAGNPWGAPKPGAVWFGTNDTCFGTGADRAVAVVREETGEQIVTPVDPPPAADRNLNGFAVTSGLLSEVYVPDRGEVRFRAAASRLDGTLGLQGVGALTGAGGRAVYTATFTAALVSDDPEALVSSPTDPVPGAAAAPPVAELANGTRYTVRTVTAFTDRAGHPEFVARARERFAAAVFVVDARDGGRFGYAPADSRDDLYPVSGTVVGDGPVFVLAGRRAAGEGALAVTTEVGGTLDLSGGAPVVRLTLTTTSAAGPDTRYDAEAVLQ